MKCKHCGSNNSSMETHGRTNSHSEPNKQITEIIHYCDDCDRVIMKKTITTTFETITEEEE